ncbi:MAG: DUF2971 domain-containing protein [Salinivirgaceae bacterium]|nr:DUF2971 domain-containing protein [Salinivirgaceae bacterium]
MLKKHKYVGCDFSDSATIWKYLSFTAFLAMLEDKSLYFTRAKCFADPNEFPVYENDAEVFPMKKEKYEEMVEQFKKKAFVNCWRLSEYESFGMWNAYADMATGIAIKSDVKSLFSAFNSIPQNTEIDVLVGKVNYDIKEMTQKPGWRLNVLYIPFAKTIPYENEKELRLLYHDYKNEITSDYKGYSVDIGTLIKEIYIGPMTKPYVKELIEKILSHHGLNIPVKQSMVK